MCNLYNMTTNQAAIRDLFKIIIDNAGNLEPKPIYPDQMAPVIHMTNSQRALAMMRWGMPGSKSVLEQKAKTRAAKLTAKGKSFDFAELLRMERDEGLTNIRETASPHWRRWLGPENRCLVPFTQFSEFNKEAGGNIWFAHKEQPLLAFAGIWTEWTSVRKVKEGLVTTNLFGFLTCKANAEVFAIHPKAMPVILTTPEEHDIWLRAPANEALALQRPLADGELVVVKVGTDDDKPVSSD